MWFTEPGHKVKRFAVAIDDETVYLPFAVLIGLLYGDVRDLSVCQSALACAMTATPAGDTQGGPRTKVRI
jgi:hypothetical protein